jgi:hypothetical protein
MPKSRTNNFTPTKDEYLLRSWLEISTNTLINNSQKKDKFWEQIAKQFNKYSGGRWETKSLANRYAASPLFQIKYGCQLTQFFPGGTSFERQHSSLLHFTTKSRGIPLLEQPK